jgi:MmeI, target recognition domain
VFTFDDAYSFGILSSAIHRLWFEARCSRLETRLRYTPTTVFDSFPWPQAPTLQQITTIEQQVDELLALRADNLDAKMSLARQYDTLKQPGKSRLRHLHELLDAAVLDAYGFTKEDDLLAQLLALNLDLAADPDHARGPGLSSHRPGWVVAGVSPGAGHSCPYFR